MRLSLLPSISPNTGERVSALDSFSFLLSSCFLLSSSFLLLVSLSLLRFRSSFLLFSCLSFCLILVAVFHLKPNNPTNTTPKKKICRNRQDTIECQPQFRKKVAGLLLGCH